MRTQKSTGPRTERGRKYSRRNALKHGFYAKLAISNLEKMPGYEQLEKILEELESRYVPKTLVEQLRIEKAAIDLWRHGRSVGAEMFIGDAFVGHVDNMPTVLRYMAQAERSLWQSLEVLEQIEEKTPEAEEVAGQKRPEKQGASSVTDEDEPKSDREVA